MPLRVDVKPELLHWACARNGKPIDAYARRFPKLSAWAGGETQPTFKQLEAFGKATHTPIGYFFLLAPPAERVPIPDFRTMASEGVRRPSPDLLDTVYLCQQRQAWYREFARSSEAPRPFIGSSKSTDGVEASAARIRETLGFDIDQRRKMGTWTDALRLFISQADAAGVLVMVNGVVGANNRRKLSPEEFRGFALSDDLAPVVFINGADTKAAQMFTLAHELAHLWLGESALSDAEPVSTPQHRIEAWCNRVAAELLVPLARLRDDYEPAAELSSEVTRLTRRFKVSSLVMLRRIHDAGGISRERMWAEYTDELERLNAIPRASGGSFYLTHAARVSKRFGRALVVSTWEGRSSFTEAFRLLGIKKMETFQRFGQSLGLPV